MKLTSDSTDHLLIVEDDPEMLDTLREILVRVTPNILTASNGREALHLASNHTIAALVSDVNVPGISGPELLEKLRHRRISVPTVLLSGSGYVQASTGDQPEVYCLPKPFPVKVLLELARNAFYQGVNQNSEAKKKRASGEYA